MKLLFVSIVLFCAIAPAKSQITHTLIANDHYFDPDTLYISPGDTVDVTIIGYHSATEIDSIDWVANIDNPNGGFDVGFGAPTTDTWFVINTAGTYYYICEPHAEMGMKGVIIVGEAAEIEEQYLPHNFTVFQSDSKTLNLTYMDSDQVDIFDVNGRHISTQPLVPLGTQATINIDFNGGIYFFRFSKNGHLRMNKKVAIRKS